MKAHIITALFAIAVSLLIYEAYWAYRDREDFYELELATQGKGTSGIQHCEPGMLYFNVGTVVKPIMVCIAWSKPRE